ncbi:MAG: hypothetical protein JWL84_6142 [Rhodospirillales bacterium]|jgi:uncharacterized repeat protein (TIGR03803 family)|nr:hypothetical protein [Rhodospirillales bacterium]
MIAVALCVSLFATVAAAEAATYQIIHHFDPSITPTMPNGGLLVGSDGALYGTTFGGGANRIGTVFKLTPAQPRPSGWGL